MGQALWTTEWRLGLEGATLRGRRGLVSWALDSMRPPLNGSHLSRQRVAWLNAEEASAVLSAYVLIETEVGKVAHVAQALSDLDSVLWPKTSPDPYDVIARVQAPGLDQLGRLVVSRIQVVDGVTRTPSCMVMQRSCMLRPSLPSCRPTIAVQASRSRKGTRARAALARPALIMLALVSLRGRVKQ